MCQADTKHTFVEKEKDFIVTFVHFSVIHLIEYLYFFGKKVSATSYLTQSSLFVMYENNWHVVIDFSVLILELETLLDFPIFFQSFPNFYPL